MEKLNLKYYSSNVESMSSMFEQSENIIFLNILNFEATNDIEMSHMFSGFNNLKSFDL